MSTLTQIVRLLEDEANTVLTRTGATGRAAAKKAEKSKAKTSHAADRDGSKGTGEASAPPAPAAGPAFTFSSLFPPSLIQPLDPEDVPVSPPTSSGGDGDGDGLPLSVSPAALEAARFIHLVASASPLSLQMLVGAGGLAALVHVISFCVLIPAADEALSSIGSTTTSKSTSANSHSHLRDHDVAQKGSGAGQDGEAKGSGFFSALSLALPSHFYPAVTAGAGATSASQSPSGDAGATSSEQSTPTADTRHKGCVRTLFLAHTTAIAD